MTAVHRKFDRPAVDMSGKSVLVTGGTGSFARAFVDTLLSKNPPRRLVVFSRDEQKQDTMAREVAAAHSEHADRMRYFIGDVLNECQNPQRLCSYLESFGYRQEALLSHHDYLFSRIAEARKAPSTSANKA